MKISKLLAAVLAALLSGVLFSYADSQSSKRACSGIRIEPTNTGAPRELMDETFRLLLKRLQAMLESQLPAHSIFLHRHMGGYQLEANADCRELDEHARRLLSRSFLRLSFNGEPALATEEDVSTIEVIGKDVRISLRMEAVDRLRAAFEHRLGESLYVTLGEDAQPYAIEIDAVQASGPLVVPTDWASPEFLDWQPELPLLLSISGCRECLATYDEE